MADEISKVDYFYVMVPDKPGAAASILYGLHEAGINLVAFSGFPKGRKGQLDFIPSDSAAFVKAARKMKLTISKKKTGFLLQGDDRPGTMAAILGRLAAAKINVVSSQAICAGGGRYAGLLWVNPADIKKTARLLEAGWTPDFPILETTP